MNIDMTSLKGGERAILALRSLYERHGYTGYKMSKFEEYDLYARNKEFLVSDNVITFNDNDGRFTLYFTPLLGLLAATAVAAAVDRFRTFHHPI